MTGSSIDRQGMPVSSRKHHRQVFHMHLISDATGETLNTVARARRRLLRSKPGGGWPPFEAIGAPFL
jgi:hypothetical protein